MSKKIAGVLLAPTAGDPLGLLKRGPLGYRPPYAWQIPATLTGNPYAGTWLAGQENGRPGRDMANPRALVLAWNGNVHRHGCYHAVLAANDAPAEGRYLDGFFHAAAVALLYGEDVGEGAALKRDPRWRVVLVDVGGTEIT